MSIAATVDKTHQRMVHRAQGKKSVDRVEVKKADDGSGYITRTHYNHRGGEYESPKEGVHKSLNSVHKHMKECMDDEAEEKE